MSKLCLVLDYILVVMSWWMWFLYICVFNNWVGIYCWIFCVFSKLSLSMWCLNLLSIMVFCVLYISLFCLLVNG